MWVIQMVCTMDNGERRTLNVKTMDEMRNALLSLDEEFAPRSPEPTPEPTATRDPTREPTHDTGTDTGADAKKTDAGTDNVADAQMTSTTETDATKADVVADTKESGTWNTDTGADPSGDPSYLDTLD